MMNEDESLRKKPSAHEIGQDLSQLAIKEIDERIVVLQAEIERLKTAREKKVSTQAAADALFRR